METFIILASITAVCVIWSVFVVRRGARRTKVDPEAIKRTRLSGDGGGWLYNDNWPRRKNKKH